MNSNWCLILNGFFLSPTSGTLDTAFPSIPQQRDTRKPGYLPNFFFFVTFRGLRLTDKAAGGSFDERYRLEEEC